MIAETDKRAPIQFFLLPGISIRPGFSE